MIVVYLLAFLFAFFFPNLLFWCLGMIFYRFPRTHYFGIKMLAMSMIGLKKLPNRCNLCCCPDGSCKCWNCPRFGKEI